MTDATKPRLLIVEDNHASAQLYRRILEGAGYATEHAASARDGLQKANAFRPDAIVLDLQIPSEPDLADENVEHGFRLLDDLVRADPFRPICILSAHSDRELVRRASQKTHGGQFVFKDDKDLPRALRRAVDVSLASPAFQMSKTVRAFRALVDKLEPDEHVYRRFIHQNWRVILGPEYVDCRSPHTIARGSSIDLLAVRADGFADLWELKRPGDPVFTNYNHHIHHSLECARAIGQLMEYCDAAEKERPGLLNYEGRRGLSAQIHRPRGFVVIGRYTEDAERERLRLENRFLSGLTILTYDDLIERAEQFLLFLQSYRNGDGPDSE